MDGTTLYFIFLISIVVGPCTYFGIKGYRNGESSIVNDWVRKQLAKKENHN